MDELVALGFGISGIVLVSALFAYIKRLKKKLRRYVLRFEQIKDKFE